MKKSKADRDAEILGTIIGILLTIFILIPILTVYSVVAQGFVISWLWEWYIVPLGMSSLTLIHAYGISLILYVTTHQHTVYKNANNELSGEKITTGLIAPWWALLIGWILHTMFMGG